MIPLDRITAAMKDFDVRSLELPEIDLPKFDMRSFDIPKFEMPKFDMPKFDMPALDLPKIDLPHVDLTAQAERAADFARDAAYVGVGAAVVAAQKIDERRRELTDEVGTQVRKLTGRAA